MKFILTENQSYDMEFLAVYEAKVSGNEILIRKELAQIDIDTITIHINEMTNVERKLKNDNDKFNRIVDAELEVIDRASIRSLREYVAAQVNAPQFIKDYEQEAIAKRLERK